MRALIAILIFSILTAFQNGQEMTIEQFAQSQLDDFKIIPCDKSEYLTYSLERFQLHNNKIEIAIKAKKPHSNKNSYDKTVYTRIQMWQFDFETEEKCKQAADSLLNCFPNDCFKIKRHTDQGIKITPSIWILQERTIYIAKTACEQVDEKWAEFQSEFADKFADFDTEIIITECGKLTWTTKEKIKNAP